MSRDFLDRHSHNVRALWRRAVGRATGVIAVVAAMTVAPAGHERSEAPRPIPLPAVPAIANAFKDYRLVAIGEMHRNEQVHELVRSLLHDPRFLPNGGDIVVEFGNARYQEFIDRFIAGEDIPSEELVHVWRETVNILVWDAPVYELFFRTVQAVNRTRESAHRLRVVLADPPIDWNTIHDRLGWEQVVATRDRHAADVIDREVLNRGRSGLLIFGSGHVENENAFEPSGKPDRTRPPNLAALLEQEHPGITFIAMADWIPKALDARLAAWRPPVLVGVKGTWLGSAHGGGPRLEELAGAFLYLGATTSLRTSRPSPEIYRDRTYLRELIRRDAIQGGANSAELRWLSAMFLDGKSP